MKPSPAARLSRACVQLPGLGMRLDTTKLDLVYKDQYSKELPDAYERLLLDVVNGACVQVCTCASNAGVHLFGHPCLHANALAFVLSLHVHTWACAPLMMQYPRLIQGCKQFSKPWLLRDR